MSIADRIAAVRQQIADACERCGRDPSEVALLAVSKTHAGDKVRAAFAAGQRAFGENRVQELVPKAEQLNDLELAWHMIGSLQTNKVGQLLEVPRLELLHSLDRRKLADRLQAGLDERGRDLDVLLQVNATEEVQKHGVTPEDALALAQHIGLKCPRLRLVGLMAMGPLEGDPAPTFARVAALREELRDGSGLELPTLSLGMTGDLVEAIAAGSTMVRVGTGVFGPRE